MNEAEGLGHMLKVFDVLSVKTSPKKLTTRDPDAFSSCVFELVRFNGCGKAANHQMLQTPPSDTDFGVLQANQRRFFHPQKT